MIQVLLFTQFPLLNMCYSIMSPNLVLFLYHATTLRHKTKSTRTMATFSCSRASYTCSFLYTATSISTYNLNPISLFGLILHVHPPTSSTAFHAANFVNLTWLKLADRRLSGRFAEHLCSVSNNDVNQHVARHFNIVNHLYGRREEK